MGKHFVDRICEKCKGRFHTSEKDRSICRSCEQKIEKTKKPKQKIKREKKVKRIKKKRRSRKSRKVQYRRYVRNICDHIIDNISRIKTERERREKYVPILNARLIEGKTLQEVGNQFGLTRERVRQICNQYATRYGFEKARVEVTPKREQSRKKERTRYTSQQKYIRSICNHIINNISRIKTEKKRREKYIAILNARLVEGKSLQEVGDRFGYTKGRVWQICKQYAHKYGFEETKVRVTSKKKPSRKGKGVRKKIVAHGERNYRHWKGKPIYLVSGLYGMFDFVNSEILKANREELVEITKKYHEFIGAKETLEEREEFTTKFIRPLISGSDTDVEKIRNILYEIQLHTKGRLEDIMRITKEYEDYKKHLEEIFTKSPEEMTEEERAEIADVLLMYVRKNQNPFLIEKLLFEMHRYEMIPKNQRTDEDLDVVRNALIEVQKDVRSLLFS